jgi:hypothetical protein
MGRGMVTLATGRKIVIICKKNKDGPILPLLQWLPARATPPQGCKVLAFLF